MVVQRDTTAQALSWTYFHLLSSPHLFEKMRAEVDKIDVNFDNFKELHFLVATFNEVSSSLQFCSFPSSRSSNTTCAGRSRFSTFRDYDFILPFRKLPASRIPTMFSQTARLSRKVISYDGATLKSVETRKYGGPLRRYSTRLAGLTKQELSVTSPLSLGIC